MNIMIPRDKIDEIRERINIVHIVSEYVPLKKSGRNHTGLCPFHSEKTPSFTVNDEKQIFYCFGCNTGGNVFTFLMKQENLSFPEAVRTVAKRLGIEIPTDKKLPEKENERELLFMANHAAQEFYHQNLLTLPDGEKARAYVKNRGLKPEIIKNFKIGYAPQGRNSLVRFLEKKGISMELAEKAGLVSRKGRDFFDRYRNRIIFPIADARNRVVGFGGRSLGNDEPKYLNSPNSPVFRKGEVVYGMYQAKNSASTEGFVLVVEGYFDLLTMHQHGFSNTVATLGTALTADHLRKLRGYTKEVYTLFDSDEAGRAAALRSIPLFIDEDMRARIVLIPAGLDPDELLRKNGAAAMAECIQKAKPVIDFLIHSIRSKFDTDTPSGKVSFLEEAVPYIARIKNDMERSVYIEKAAALLSMRPEAILSAIKGSARAAATGKSHQRPPAVHEIIQRGDSSRTEEMLLKVILAYPHLLCEPVITAIETFNTDFLKETGRLIVDAIRSGGGKLDLSSAIDSATSDKAKAWLLKTSVTEDDSIKEEPEKILEDCCRKVLTNGRLKKETSAILKKLAEAEKAGDANGFRILAESYLAKKRE